MAAVRNFVTKYQFTCNRFVAATRAIHTTGHVPCSASAAVSTTDTPSPPTAPSSHVSPSVLHDRVAHKFVNCMMWDGKKSLSQHIFKEALEIVKRSQLAKGKKREDAVLDAMEIFHKAVDNAKPIMGTTGVRRGGKLYHVPVALRPERQEFLAVKWLITAAREKPGHGMAKKLAAELLDAFNHQGAVIKRKQDLHRLAEANRAFAHFRW
ncbi:hypothetical protein EMCRGX_G001803 [Ephydatia muelleri]|eukprot:Em0001g1613a